MSEAVMDQVVEPFFTTRGRSGGTGLGLSIVYGVIRSVHGQLHIESTIDEGTTFEIYLPYCDEVPEEVNEGVGARTSSFPAHSAQVLLVDDDPAVRRSVARLVGMEGHEVFAAEGPAEAERVFGEQPIDVLVSDITMPGGCGLELARSLLERSPELGVVFVSGTNPAEAKIAELRSENVRFLSKPASRHELRNAVRSVTRPPRRRQQPSTAPPAF